MSNVYIPELWIHNLLIKYGQPNQLNLEAAPPPGELTKGANPLVWGCGVCGALAALLLVVALTPAPWFDWRGCGSRA